MNPHTILIILVTFLCGGLAQATPKPSPLGLDCQSSYEVFPTPDGYRYYMGDLSWGKMVFVGTRDLLAMETELQVFFYKKRIAKIILILGPAGVSSSECLVKYRQIVSFLNKKYGKFNYQKVIKDPTLDELVYVGACYPISIDMLELSNHWKTPAYTISTKLIGDDDGFYIEIEYTIDNREKQFNNKRESQILKGL